MGNVSELLEATTFIYRKTDEVVTESRDGVSVTHVWLGTPELTLDNVPDEATHVLVDMHFFVVAVNRAAAEERRAEFEEICETWPPDPTYMPENRLAGGPGYIELGAQIGTMMGQQDAMCFMALGEALGAWEVITPERLWPGIPEEDANRAAGGGLVMISGYQS